MSNRILDLKLTYRCNNNCIYCCQKRNLRHVGSDMEYNRIRKIIDSEYSINKVVLTGGEPTLSTELINIVKYIKKKNICEIQLQTNARVLANINYLKEIIDAGVNSFGISLHGEKADIHELFTGTKGSFDDVIKALYNIKKYDLPVALNCVITKHNINHLSEIVEFVSENDLADSLQFAFIHITGKAENGIKDFVKISKAASEVRKVIENNKNNELKIYTEAIPFCLMLGCEKNVAELYNNGHVVTYDFNGKREFSNEISTRFKQKGPLCKDCLFDSICEGSWKEYPDIYGFHEFVPVVDFRGEY